jgi:hypothetical protein
MTERIASNKWLSGQSEKLFSNFEADKVRVTEIESVRTARQNVTRGHSNNM